jgi:hypothetical protein
LNESATLRSGPCFWNIGRLNIKTGPYADSRSAGHTALEYQQVACIVWHYTGRPYLLLTDIDIPRAALCREKATGLFYFFDNFGKNILRRI